MSALNVVILIGRLVKDPELRYTTDGKAVCHLRLAVDRGVAGPNGEKLADFIDIVVWEKQAETCANHLSKGRLVCVQGRLQIRQYTTQEGQRREKAEVVAYTVRFLDFKSNSANQGNGQASGSNEGAVPEDEYALDDEDVPF